MPTTCRGPRECQGAAFTSCGPLRKPRCLSGAASPAHRTRGPALRNPRRSSPSPRRPPQVAGRLLYPGAWGLGQERGQCSSSRGAQECFSPQDKEPKTREGHAERPRRSRPTVRTAVQPMATSRGASVPRRTTARNVPQGPTTVYICQAGVNTGGEHLARADHVSAALTLPAHGPPAQRPPGVLGVNDAHSSQAGSQSRDGPCPGSWRWWQNQAPNLADGPKARGSELSSRTSRYRENLQSFLQRATFPSVEFPRVRSLERQSCGY